VARILAVVSLIAFATLSLAQAADKINLKFPTEASRKVWIQVGSKAEEVPEGVNSVAKSLELPVTADDKAKNIYVADLESGNVAVKPVSQALATGTWEVQTSDYKFLYEMRFRLESGGKRVSAAQVDVGGAKGSRVILLTPEDNGEVVARIVPVGDVPVTVTYREGDQTKRLPKQVFEAKLNAGTSNLTVIELPEGTPVLEEAPAEPSTPTAAGSKTETPAKPSAESGGYSPLQTLFNFVIGLALVGGIAYGIYRYFTANREKVETALKQAGLPGAADPGDVTGAAPVAPAAPKPIQPIQLGSDASVSAAAPIAASTPFVKNPRLIGDGGELFLLSDGELIVGREAPAEIVLAGDGSVSRRHASISIVGETVTVSDLGSTNGTFVNGAKVASPVTLRHSDSVQFGSAKLRFEE